MIEIIAKRNEKSVYIPRVWILLENTIRAGTRIFNTFHEVGYFPTFKQSFYSLGDFKLLFQAQNVLICFSKWRKFVSTSFFLFLFLSFQSSSANQSEAFLPWGLFGKTKLQIVTCKFPKCTSIYKWNLQVHLSVHINVLCLTVILTVKLFRI